MKIIVYLLLSLGLAYAARYELEHRQHKETKAVAYAKSERHILHYRCPMHPTYRSDHPGTAPCCGMAYEPVYASDDVAPERSSAAAPPGTVHISPEQQQLIGITYEAVAYRPVYRTVSAPAKLGWDETKVARVQTKLEGWIDQVHVPYPGTVVHKNQQLLTLYNPQSLTAQQAFLAEMKMGPSTANTPPANERSLIMARRKLELLGFTDEQIETIGRVRAPMEKLILFAPINGVVVECNARVGQKVTPETLYTIADLSSLWATADLFEGDAASVTVGQSATMTIPYLPGRTFHGFVDSVLPLLDAASHTTKVRVRFENPAALLKPEMYGEVEFRNKPVRRLTVPREAVLDSGLEQVVFIDSGKDRLEPHRVRTGQRFGDRVEILSGLQPGQRVVTSGNFLLDSESRLRAPGISLHDQPSH
jgi:Cu(I)/Ag(I) efflux system membrane fusion protein